MALETAHPTSRRRHPPRLLALGAAAVVVLGGCADEATPGFLDGDPGLDEESDRSRPLSGQEVTLTGEVFNLLGPTPS